MPQRKCRKSLRAISRAIYMITVRISITDGIEPITGHLLAVVRRIQEPLHNLGVGFRTAVGKKSIHFLDRQVLFGIPLVSDIIGRISENKISWGAVHKLLDAVNICCIPD